MKIKEYLSHGNEASHAKGYICLEYTDPITGKVRERVEGNNHVFMDSFRTTNWWAILSNNAKPWLFLTDTHTPADDFVPYLRGNIIGWGQRGQGSSGNFRGAHNVNESLYDHLLPGGEGVRWRHVYEFASHQVPDTVKTIGITTQYDAAAILSSALNMENNVNNVAITNPNILLRSNRPRRVTPGGIEVIFKNNIGYRIAPDFTTSRNIDTRSPIIRNPANGIINIPTSLAPVPAGTVTHSVGIAFDSDKCYLLARSSITGNSRLYEFRDNTFSVLLNTYNVSNIGAPGGGMFAVYGSRLVYVTLSTGPGTARTVHHYDFITNAAPTTVNILPCPFNSSTAYASASGLTNFMSMGVKGNLLFLFLGTNRTDAMSWPIINLETMEAVGTLANTNALNGWPVGCDQDISMPGKPFIIMDYIAELYQGMKQALCCYSPIDFPVRPPGTGIKISYQIDVVF